MTNLLQVVQAENYIHLNCGFLNYYLIIIKQFPHQVLEMLANRLKFLVSISSLTHF